MAPALSSFRWSPVGSELVRQWSMFRFVVVVAIGFATLVSASNLSLAQTATTTARVVPASLRIRAFGDAVTAGFGIDASGLVVPREKTIDCRPKWIGDGTATTAGTRCSSNGLNGPGSSPDEISFSADFGLANKASWAAQVASQLNAIDFANYAVAGSSLVSWMNLPQDDTAPAEGAQHDLLERIERDDPDIVLATIGGDLLLQQPASPVRTCAPLSDVATQGTQFTDCVNALLDRQMTKQRIMAISFDVLAHTQNAKLLLAYYLPAEPQFSVLLPWQQTVLAQAINAQIDAAVRGVAESGAAWAQRIDVVPVAIQSDRCPPVVIAGPSFLGRTWFTPLSACGVAGVPPAAKALAFTPVSMGTVPSALLQQVLATVAVAAIQRQAWA
ncbi:unannotated protein [freshwater metagenome]|uniref:Unannotated protein n=1 Tax=freshwater metagenome TaxID=449393 RepID=A0A6J7IDS6_9ZZZZ|nr:hypothetical protein [Actinomycetota bacterium]